MMYLVMLLGATCGLFFTWLVFGGLGGRPARQRRCAVCEKRFFTCEQTYNDSVWSTCDDCEEALRKQGRD